VDTLVYQAEKALREWGDAVPLNHRSRIEAQLNDVRQAMRGEDLARIRQRPETWQQMVAAFAPQAYAGQAAGQGGSGGTPPRGETVEGECREV
jgi:molecular chaperone DnaK